MIMIQEYGGKMENLEIIAVNQNNIDTEHICCGFASANNVEGYELKRAWLRERLNEGFVFKKFNIRGKVFIEYVPAEFAWRPIDAPGYMCIQCFWVAGQFKGQGLGKRLLESCVKDTLAQGKNGLVVVTSKQKKPFLTDKSFFARHGFEVCDTAPPYFELLVRPFGAAPAPAFRPNARLGALVHSDAFAYAGDVTILYTDQCPFTSFYIDEMIAAAAGHGLSAEKIKLTTAQQVQDGPSPAGISGVYLRGQFLTHEIMTGKGFDKLLSKTLKG